MRVKLLFILIFFAIFSGCSDDPANKCDGVVCDTGVCLAETGTCGNPATCDESAPCLGGYDCLFGECRPILACNADGSCERGLCESGACVNPTSCADSSECLADHGCSDGVCVFNRCADVTCTRGECARETGECINKPVCTDATQASDCVDGFSCYGQVCQENEEICRDFPCERGACDAATRSCVNAGMCASDTDCLDGFFCDDASACAANVCDANMVTCERGVCDLRTGECINATDCSASTECTDGFTCVGRMCVEAGQECGDACEGNQRCSVDAQALSATCVESPTGCNNKSDCLGDRLCRNGICVDTATCVPDAFEPNDASPTDFSAVATSKRVSASLCNGDTDLYNYDTRDSALFTGTLLALLVVDGEDVGLGSVTLDVVDAQGTVVGTATADAQGQARVEYAVTALKRGVYTARVRGANVHSAGVRYRLVLDLLDPVVIQACSAAEALVSGQTVSGNTTSGASYQLGSSCTAVDNPAGEDIYTFTLTAPHFVTLNVTPQNGAALSFSLRTQCEVGSIDLACESPAGSAAMSYRKILNPGTYFVVVQGSLGNPGGDYTLEFDAAATVCTDADNQCVGADGTFTYYCNATGTGFLTAACANGCDPTTGSCVRRPADVCGTAIDASSGYTGNISWGTMQNDYDPGVSGCVPNNSGTQTNGPDAAFVVQLPAQSRVRASLTRSTGDYVSLYIVRNCNDTSTCVAGANAGQFTNEETFYTNTSNVAETVFVIADAEQDTSYGSSAITIDVAPLVCTPSTSTCNGAVEVTCNADGTVTTPQTCTFGCTNGSCEPVVNDQCGGAISLSGTTHTGQIEEYVNDYSGPCTGRSTAGADAAYAVTPPAGQVATATVTANFDVGIYVLKDCADASACTAGADVANANSELVQWLSDGSTYYVIVDSTSTSATGAYTVDVNWQSPTCTPGQNLGCSDGTTLSYCGPLGLPLDFTCGGACSNGACTMPEGQLCLDAIPLTDGFTDTRAFNGTNTVEPGLGSQGACTFTASNRPVGVDVVYSATLTAGQVLTATYTSSSSFATMYLLGDCFDGSSCLDQTSASTGGKIVYQAPQDETIYLVMDRTQSATTTLTYSLSTSIKTPNCTPGQPASCTSATDLGYCDDLGFLQTFACPGTGGCLDGGCVTPSGNICADPIVLGHGSSVTGTVNRTTAVDSVVFSGSQNGLCRMDDVINTVGRDTIYAIDLQPGDVLRAKLNTTTSTAFMAILTSCDADSCVAAPVSGGSGELVYTTPTGGRHFIVVDATTATATPTNYTLETTVLPGGVCTPNTASCSGGVVTYCDATGFNATPYVCPSTCDSVFGCAVDTGAQACATAPMISGGVIVTGSFGNLTNNVSLPNTTCAGTTATGPEAIYTVSLQPGEILYAKMRSLGQESPVVYVMTDCTQGNTCLAGGRSLNFESELYYPSQTSQTVYLVADSTTASADEPFELVVEILTAECAPGDSYCDADGTTLQLCNVYGLYEPYVCNGSCVNNVCANPRGDDCRDPLVLTHGESYTGTMTNRSSDLDPLLGTCVLSTSHRQDDRDMVFAVDLQAGERLDAVLNTTSSAFGMYVLDSCGGNTNTACRTAAVFPYRTLSFVAETAQRYYLVVDSEYYVTTPFTVSVEISPGWVCVPGSSSCDGGTLSQCSSDGQSVLSTTQCMYGCGNDVACAAPTTANNTCAGAETITANTTILDTYDRFTGTQNPGSTCAKQAASGPDAFYRVTIPQDHVLIATLVAADTYINPSLYLFDDCANAAATCLAGAASSTQQVQLKYATTASKTAYLAVDSDWLYDDEPFYLDIRFQPKECTQGETMCSGDNLLTCNAYGLWDASSCYFGCAVGACLPTPNDQCAGAVDVTNGGTFRAAVNLYRHDYNPMINNTSCTGDDATGADAVYSMNLNQGDWVSLSLAGPTDPVLYVTTTCGNAAAVATSCVAGSDDLTAPERLEFVAPSTGTYYIVADLDTTSTTGEFVLNVERQSAGTCTPGVLGCLDANTVQFCDNQGTTLVAMSCVDGCVNGTCVTPRGDNCADPIDATGGGLWTVNLDGYRNDYDLTSTSCVGYDTPGNDVVFKVELLSGESLDARVTGPTGENPALYLVSDCGAIRDQINDHACIDGSDTTGNLESLAYVPSGPETVYVVLDARSISVDDGIFTMDLFAGPACNVGGLSCKDANTLAYCPSGTRENYYACQGGCSGGVCGSPTGDICGDPIVATTGTYTGNYAGSSAVNLGTGSNGACNFTSAQTGTDHTYAVDLQANQTLTATFSTNSSFGIMYLTSDCYTGASCLANTTIGSGGSLNYTATQNERVYVVIDRTLSGSDSYYTYTLDVNVQ